MSLLHLTVTSGGVMGDGAVRVVSEAPAQETKSDESDSQEAGLDREEQLAQMLFEEIGGDPSRLSRFIRAFTRLQRTARSRPPSVGPASARLESSPPADSCVHIRTTGGVEAE
jgi:hypothetical protein